MCSGDGPWKVGLEIPKGYVSCGRWTPLSALFTVHAVLQQLHSDTNARKRKPCHLRSVQSTLGWEWGRP